MAQHAGSQWFQPCPDVVQKATYLVLVCPPISLFYRLARKVHPLDRGSVNSASVDHYNHSAHPLPPLKPGNHVDLQHLSTKLWQQHSTIVSVGRHRGDYHIRLPSGRVLRRNRRFLRPRVMPAMVIPSDPVPPVQPAATTELPEQPRRSTRSRKRPDRLHISSTTGQSYT